ncbi:MAG: sigma factor-like helix-turn-helix DNA-binding protein [Dysosmobacter sp.]
MTVEEVAAVELANGPLESLQQETIDGLTLESTLGTDSPEEGMVERNSAAGSHRQLCRNGKGSPLLLRFFRGMTQEQTARILKVSQVQVSRLERKGLAKLREILEA